ncbi:hypothetical protein WJM97_22355 [Okeanomitos corallinicola TIOX110]|uniref:Uncharacterized protein n=1 Tax=Okeanomitos corallinicola TIOX110 TaxID=3133117 RepID=A0ABZ2UV54_9CYAN
MNNIDKLTLKALLAALMRLEEPLPDDLQNQLKEISKTWPPDVDKLDALTEIYPPLEDEYLEARSILQNDGERFRSSGVQTVNETVNETVVLSDEKLINLALQIFSSEDSVNSLNQAYTESSPIGQFLFQLRRQTSLMAKDSQNIPEEELWVWQDPVVWASLERGLKQAQAGKGRYLGDFSQYADLEIDD